jgi:hypothetical protein
MIRQSGQSDYLVALEDRLAVFSGGRLRVVDIDFKPR